MDSGPDFSSGVVWWFTYGQPAPRVMESVGHLLEHGECDWVIVPVPVDEE